MKLWIRNQNKEALVHINGMIITKAHRIGNGKDELVYMIKETSSDTLLGEYETKRRALEVLDDIQDLLMGDVENHINKFDIYNGDNIKVYNMPQR